MFMTITNSNTVLHPDTGRG